MTKKWNILLILVLITTTILLILVDYNNIFKVKHPKVNIDFWIAYFGILVAVLFPLFLFNKERVERLESEAQVKKETEEKEEKNIFLSGISRTRPKLIINYRKSKHKNGDALLIENIGIGNATNIKFYWSNPGENNKFENMLIQRGGYKISEITMKPYDKELIDVLHRDYFSNYIPYDEIINFEKLIIIYTNLLGSEIYISEHEVDNHKVTVHHYFSSYNYRDPELCGKNELAKIVQGYVNDSSLEYSVYRYKEFMKKMEDE